MIANDVGSGIDRRGVWGRGLLRHGRWRGGGYGRIGRRFGPCLAVTLRLRRSRRRNDALIELSEVAAFGVIARRIEQVEDEPVAVLGVGEATLQPQPPAFGAERAVIGGPPLALIGDAPIDVLLTQALELQAFALLASRLVGACHFTALPLVDLLGVLLLFLEPLDSIALAVVIAHGASFLGAIPHEARGLVLRGGPPTEQPAAFEAALGLRFELLAGPELLAASLDPTGKGGVPELRPSEQRPSPGRARKREHAQRPRPYRPARALTTGNGRRSGRLLVDDVPYRRTPAPTRALGAGGRGRLRIQRSNEHECGALTHSNTERRVGPPLDPDRADSTPAKVLAPKLNRR
jgi:hypothetical protein